MYCIMPATAWRFPCEGALETLSGHPLSQPEGRQDALLNAQEDSRVADLVQVLDEPFDAQNPDHLSACHQLWQAAWPNVPFQGVVHTGWKRLGFRTGDLTDELRAGGIASVHHLLKLATFSPMLFTSALEANCPLAQASLSVAFLLRGFLRLHAPGTVPQPSGGCGRVASKETLRRFLAWDKGRCAQGLVAKTTRTPHLLAGPCMPLPAPQVRCLRRAAPRVYRVSALRRASRSADSSYANTAHGIPQGPRPDAGAHRAHVAADSSGRFLPGPSRGHQLTLSRRRHSFSMYTW